MGAGAADIAEIVSDVRDLLPDLQPMPQLEPELAPHSISPPNCEEGRRGF